MLFELFCGQVDSQSLKFFLQQTDRRAIRLSSRVKNVYPVSAVCCNPKGELTPP